MKVVVDTNVVISGVFFGGYPRQILEAAVKKIKIISITYTYELSLDCVTEKNHF